MARTTEERREYLRVWTAKWRAQHHEAFCEYRRRHYARNRAHISQWRKNNRASSDTERLAAKKRYADNRDARRAAAKKRRDKKEAREKARVATAKWRAEHPERARAGCRRYQKAHPEAFQKSTATRRARKLNAFVEVVDPIVVFHRDKGKCGICMKRVDPVSKWHVDHIIPLVKGGNHSYANVQLAHGRCNQQKHTTVPIGQPTLFQVAVT